MKCPFLSLVIPAYNEANRIYPLLSELVNPDIEYLIICDGTDNTEDVVRAYASQNPDLTIRIYSFSVRLGKGGGVRVGFRKASAPLVGFIDADNSTPVSELIRMVSLIGNHDGIIGSRHLPGQILHRRQPLFRRIQSRMFNWIIHLLFELPFHDTQCGAKVFRREALEAVLPSLRCNGFEFDVELLWHMKKRGYSIVEVPVIWKDTLDSRLCLVDVFSMFLTLIRIRIHSPSHGP